MRKLTQEEFLKKAENIHSKSYDYSLVEYVDFRTPIKIICHKHGLFTQIPRDHLSGKGCMLCGREKTTLSKKNKPCISNRRKIFGIGINDYPYPIFINGKVIEAYDVWHSMLNRCYGKTYQKNEPSYIGCKVCDEWLYFSKFKEWFDSENSGYREGYQLDKDILIKNNKLYSQNTCVFVPQQINSLFCFSKRNRGNLPIGVAKSKNRYYAFCMNNNVRKYIGLYPTIISAFNAYKTYKEQHIKDVAEKYYTEGKISEKVYKAMLNYNIEITD